MGSTVALATFHWWPCGNNTTWLCTKWTFLILWSIIFHKVNLSYFLIAWKIYPILLLNCYFSLYFPSNRADKCVLASSGFQGDIKALQKNLAAKELVSVAYSWAVELFVRHLLRLYIFSVNLSFIKSSILIVQYSSTDTYYCHPLSSIPFSVKLKNQCWWGTDFLKKRIITTSGPTKYYF